MSGCQVVHNRLPRLPAEIQQRIGTVVRQTLAKIETRAKASMTGPKHGRTYRKGRIGRRMTKSLMGAGLRTYTTAKGNTMAIVGYKMHRASAPGEAPAVDTGALMNATRSRMVGPMKGIVYNNQAYAARLELDMNRPFLAPAAQAEAEDFVTAVKEEFGKL